MKFAQAAVLILAAACSKSDGAPEPLVKASTDQPDVAAAPALIPLDMLVAQLDSAHGFYWPQTRRHLELTNATLHADQFRAHGKAAVLRLIDCLSDTTSTSTYHADDMSFKYPRGALCYEVLRAIVDFDESRQLPLRHEDVFVSMASNEVDWELIRAKRAWQVIHKYNAYRLRTLNTP
jgi:hypothetical protein